MLIKEYLADQLVLTIKELPQFEALLKHSNSKIKIDTANPKFGDYAINIAMVWSHALKTSPQKIAETIVQHLKQSSLYEKDFKRIDIAGPGFINLLISDRLRHQGLQAILQRSNLNQKELHFPNLVIKNQGKKVLLEYVSANPTGPLHVGHGRWAVIGSVLAKVLSLTGYQVHQECYINDAGKQVEKFYESIDAVKAGKTIPEDGYHGEYIFELAKLNVDPIKTIIAEHKTVLKNAATYMDEFFSEQSLYDRGLVTQILDYLKQHNLAYYKDKAWWFASSTEGDDKDRVLVRSNGEITYFGVDVAYHHTKFTRGYNLLINVLGADHHGYVKRIQSAVSLITQKQAQLKVIIGQLVSVLRNGKPVRMSKRSGDIVLMNEVVEEIGVDAFRYFFSMRSPNMPLEFDLDVAKEKSLNNPVYYIQYTHARIHSIFVKADTMNIKRLPLEKLDFTLISNQITIQIVNKILEWEEEILMVSENFEIQHINNYLYDLSSLFHRYYNQEVFLTDGSVQEKELSSQRLLLLKAIDQIIIEGLSILGISTPDNM